MTRRDACTAEDAHGRANADQSLSRLGEFCDNLEDAPRLSARPCLLDQLGRQGSRNLVCTVHRRRLSGAARSTTRYAGGESGESLAGPGLAFAFSGCCGELRSNENASAG